MKHTSFLFVLFFALVPSIAFAINLNLDYPEFGGFDLNTRQALPEIIAFFYYFIVGIAGLAAFVMLVWGGIQWLVSGAIPAQASEARDKIRNAIIGLLLILASFLIIQVINPELTILGSQALTDVCDDPANAEKCAGALGEHGPGVYLCDEPDCQGEFIYIDPSIPGCEEINDFNNMPTNCDPDNKSTSTSTNWDNKTSAVKLDSTLWTVALFEDPVPRAKNRAICFQGNALDLERYHRGFFGPTLSVPDSWDDMASAMYVSPVGEEAACASHGITLPGEDEAPPNGRIDQPVAFLFKHAGFSDAEGRWEKGIPLNSWAPGEFSSGDATKSEYESPFANEIHSIWLAAQERRCALDTSVIIASADQQSLRWGRIAAIVPPLGSALTNCAVFVSDDPTATFNPSTDTFICFTSSVENTEERLPGTGDYKYSFSCNGRTSIADSIETISVNSAELCSVPSVVQNCRK